MMSTHWRLNKSFDIATSKWVQNKIATLHSDTLSDDNVSFDVDFAKLGFGYKEENLAGDALYNPVA